MKRTVLLLLGLLALPACTEVQPWEKQYLAKRHMALDPDSRETRLRQHTYQSREGSFGGYGVGGGGCGCN